MKKDEILEHVKQAAAHKIVTAEEVWTAYHEGAGYAAKDSAQGPAAAESNASSDTALTKHLSISDILYFIGGLIVIMGIAVMIAGSWSELSSITRILVTLGAALTAYMVGVLLGKEKRFEGVSQAFYMISAFVMPIGVYVTFETAGLTSYTTMNQIIIWFILLFFYLASYMVFRKAVFLLFTIISGSWLFFAITNAMVEGNPSFDWTFYLYRSLLLGASYMLLGYSFAQNRTIAGLKSLMYGIGSFIFLGSALALGGQTGAGIVWQIIYPALVFSILFLSIKVKSRAFLLWGAIFLMGYILKLTGTYFSQDLGWPLALVISGLMLMVIGYYTFYINKKYLAK